MKTKQTPVFSMLAVILLLTISSLIQAQGFSDPTPLPPTHVVNASDADVSTAFVSSKNPERQLWANIILQISTNDGGSLEDAILTLSGADTTIVDTLGVASGCAYTIPQGAYYLTIVHDGYFDISQMIDVFEEALVFDIMLYLTTVDNESIDEPLFSAYPNPAKEMFHVVIPDQVKALRVYDVVGNVVYEVSNPLESIDRIENLIPGTYFVTVWMENGEQGIQKVVVF